MSKWWKITLYVILILAIITVIWLMFWNTNPNVEIQTDTETLTWESIDDVLNIPEIETDTFEEDVMKDLEWFFEGNNGYEDVQWEFWFTNPESE